MQSIRDTGRLVRRRACVAICVGLLSGGCAAPDRPAPQAARVEPPGPGPAEALVGPAPGGGHIVPTEQLVRPAGQTLEIAGRPVDLALSPDGHVLFAKDNRGLIAIDPADWSVRAELKFERDGGSMYGVAATRDGHVLATTAHNTLAVAGLDASGKLAWQRKIELKGPQGKGSSVPCGIALSPDERTVYVCLSRNNALGVVDLATGKLEDQIDVGVAPFAVRLANGGTLACVSNWGGRRAAASDQTAPSSGTPAVIDERGISACGSVSIVNLTESEQEAEIPVGLAPCALELSRDEKTLYVACANADDVYFIDLQSRQVVEKLNVRPDASLPFGSMPNGLALSPDGRTLHVSLAGNNAVAVVRLNGDGSRSESIAGYIPTAWYPGSLIAADRLYVASIKGVGSRTLRSGDKSWNSHGHRGTIGVVEYPDEAALAKMTAQCREDARVPQALAALERAADVDPGAKPAPVPARPGEPSVFEHVVYVVKENRAFDQVFGDMPRGNCDPRLCIYGREITPNHHALADEFVLLDNYYCNGVLSADGHSWATEGNVTPYLERSFGGFERSYTFGNDPLTYSSSGFIWDHVLASGRTFRNYGEFDEAQLEPKSSYATVYRDFIEGRHEIRPKQKIGVETMRRFGCPEYPGWNLDIPDILRADVFLREFAQFNQSGQLPNFMFVYLPDDHTAGTGVGHPTPRSMVADNDLALGRIVDALSHSHYWAKTCIFVIEDDPQNGFDHVDGHRSLCLVISPYTKRGQVISEFYNQTSVIHTIERIFGLAPSNQLYAMAPVMSACFMDQPDMRPYDCRPNIVPLCELNTMKPPASAPSSKPASAPSAGAGTSALALAEHMMELSNQLPLDQPDRADEDTLNRILWFAARGDEPYPAEFAGAHGRGLAALGLRLAPAGGPPEPDWDDAAEGAGDDDDDD